MSQSNIAKKKQWNRRIWLNITESVTLLDTSEFTISSPHAYRGAAA